MNKNKLSLSRRLRFWGAAALLCVLPGVPPAAAQETEGEPAAAPPVELQEGVNYARLDPPQPTRAPEGKIEVLEFFNFSCPHCFRMQGVIARWEKTNAENEVMDVALVRQPVVFQSAGGHYARLFYTLESMGLADSLFRKVFNTIHQQRILINSRDRLAAWLDGQELDGEKAAKVYDSFSVNTKVKRSGRVTEEYGVNSTPHMGVAGKYLVSPGHAGTLDRMMDIVAALVEREREELAKKAAADAAAANAATE